MDMIVLFVGTFFLSISDIRSRTVSVLLLSIVSLISIVLFGICKSYKGDFNIEGFMGSFFLSALLLLCKAFQVADAILLTVTGIVFGLYDFLRIFFISFTLLSFYVAGIIIYILAASIFCSYLFYYHNNKSKINIKKIIKQIGKEYYIRREIFIKPIPYIPFLFLGYLPLAISYTF